jgi:hypothetical protein
VTGCVTRPPPRSATAAPAAPAKGDPKYLDDSPVRPLLLARVHRRFAGAHPRAVAPPRPRLCAVPLVTGTLGFRTRDISYGNRCALPGGYLVGIVLAVGERPPVNGRAPGLDPHKLQS